MDVDNTSFISRAKDVSEAGFKKLPAVKTTLKVAAKISYKIQPERFGHAAGDLSKIADGIVVIDALKYAKKLLQPITHYFSRFSKENFDVEAYKQSVRECLESDDNRIGRTLLHRDDSFIKKDGDLDQRIEDIFQSALQKNVFLTSDVRKKFKAEFKKLGLRDEDVDELAKKTVIKKIKIENPLAQRFAQVSLFFASVGSTIMAMKKYKIADLAKPFVTFGQKFPVLKEFIKWGGTKVFAVVFAVGYGAMAAHNEYKIYKKTQELHHAVNDADKIKLAEEVDKLNKEQNIVLLDFTSSLLDAAALIMYSFPFLAPITLTCEILATVAKVTGVLCVFIPALVYLHKEFKARKPQLFHSKQIPEVS